MFNIKLSARQLNITLYGAQIWKLIFDGQLRSQLEQFTSMWRRRNLLLKIIQDYTHILVVLALFAVINLKNIIIYFDRHSIDKLLSTVYKISLELFIWGKLSLSSFEVFIQEWIHFANISVLVGVTDMSYSELGCQDLSALSSYNKPKVSGSNFAQVSERFSWL